MTTLKEAQKNNKIDQFIKEHHQDKQGDAKRFKKTLDSMCRGKSKEVREAPGQDSGGN